MNFENKVVLITGASSGMGRGIAVELAKKKCKLALAARRMNYLIELKSELNLPEEEIIILKCDVKNKNDVEAAYKMIIQKFGGIDVAILNAGSGRAMNILEYDSEYADEIIGANFFGIIYWVEQLLPDFIKNKKGIIAGMSSLADNRGYSGSGFYCASKAAATFYLEGLRIEAKPYGIKIITLRPGFVKTPLTDKNKFQMPFIMPVDKAVKKIVRGIEKEKRVIQFPWTILFLTNIIGLLPGRLYEWLAAKIKL